MASAKKPAPRRRKRTRLRHHDYSAPGYYFFTAVARGRECLFGRITSEAMVCNAAGDAVLSTWGGLPTHHPHVALDEFVVMPNHVHGIVVLLAEEDADRHHGDDRMVAARPRHGLPEIVRAFKSFSARAVNEVRGAPGESIWQRGYYERVIRNEDELARARDYVRLNPLKWHLDEENIQ